jgi:hypothetical protein
MVLIVCSMLSSPLEVSLFAAAEHYVAYLLRE